MIKSDNPVDYNIYIYIFHHKKKKKKILTVLLFFFFFFDNYLTVLLVCTVKDFLSDIISNLP